mmetsp:Transcript_52353/g.125010  ORF Transcript_52353/g.125010 Transcript_52353/m.125010 type:complete len:235 (+) Transcript_52353:180-884(+)
MILGLGRIAMAGGEAMAAVKYTAIVEHHYGTRLQAQRNLGFLAVEHLPKSIQGLKEGSESLLFCRPHLLRAKTLWNPRAPHAVVEVDAVPGSFGVELILPFDRRVPGLEEEGLASLCSIAFLAPLPPVVLELHQGLHQEPVATWLSRAKGLRNVLAIREDVLPSLAALDQAVEHLDVRRTCEKGQVRVKGQPMRGVCLVVRVCSLVDHVKDLAAVVRSSDPSDARLNLSERSWL